MISMSLSVVEFLSLQRIWKIIYWRTDTMFIKMTLKGMRADNNQKMWALFGNKEMAYDIDRSPEEQPSIEEMTRRRSTNYPRTRMVSSLNGRRQ